MSRHGSWLTPPHHQTPPSCTGKKYTPGFLDLGILHWGLTSAAQIINRNISWKNIKEASRMGRREKLVPQLHPHHSP